MILSCTLEAFLFLFLLKFDIVWNEFIFYDLATLDTTKDKKKKKKGW